MHWNAERGARALRLATACVAAWVLAGVSPAEAARLVLRIKAVNPVDQAQVVSIRSVLPEGIRSNDVTNLDGLELGYDVQNGVYYVSKQVPMGPKQTQNFNVELKDIWVIPDADLAALVSQARNLVEKLVGTELVGSATALRQQVESGAEAIRRSQAENAIRPGVTPVQHISAHDANLKLLGRVKRDIGHIENLVLESGQDPGALVGEDSRALRLRRDIELPLGSYGTARVRITAQNSSPTETRLIKVKSVLPPEVKAEDVIDAGGLSVGGDPETGTCYVYLDGVELAPGKTVTYDVTIRDKWNVNGPRVRSLGDSASNLLQRVSAKEKFASIEAMLTQAMASLQAIAAENGPGVVSPEYVAFYRDQSRRVDELEQSINRVRAALQPIEKTKKFGWRFRAPTMKTTWIIIYIILGFLALLSLLFFLRWFGKTREDRMWESLGGEHKDAGGPTKPAT